MHLLPTCHPVFNDDGPGRQQRNGTLAKESDGLDEATLYPSIQRILILSNFQGQSRQVGWAKTHRPSWYPHDGVSDPAFGEKRIGPVGFSEVMI
jgi:hypothetical protein